MLVSRRDAVFGKVVVAGTSACQESAEAPMAEGFDILLYNS